MDELSDLLYVPFEFENDGTRILYYAPEDYIMLNTEKEKSYV